MSNDLREIMEEMRDLNIPVIPYGLKGKDNLTSPNCDELVNEDIDKNDEIGVY